MLGGTCLPRRGLAVCGELMVSGVHAQSCGLGWQLPLGPGEAASPQECRLRGRAEGTGTVRPAQCAPKSTHSEGGLACNSSSRTSPSLPQVHRTVTWSETCPVRSVLGRRPVFLVSTSMASGAGTAGSRALGCWVQTGGRGSGPHGGHR